MSINIIIVKKKSKISGASVPHIKDTYKGATKFSEIYELPITAVYNAIKNKNQIRQGDFSVRHINDLISSIQSIGQLMPVLITAGNYQGDIKDVVNGFHRIEAIYKLYNDAKTNAEKRKYSVIKVANVPYSFPSLEEKQLYQIEKNIAIPAKGNDLHDYVSHVERHVGKLPASASVKEQKSFLSKCEQYCKSSWPKLHPKTRSKIINEVKKDLSNSKLRNWTASKVLNSIRQSCSNGSLLSFNWQGKKQGEWSGNVCIYPVSRLTQIVGPNTFGNIWNKLGKLKGSIFTFRQKEMVVVLWTCDTIGKTEDDVDNFRQDALSKINAANGPWFLNQQVLPGLITKILLAPQKAVGKNKENSNIFVEASIDANGNFTLDIPHPNYGDLRKGW